MSERRRPVPDQQRARRDRARAASAGRQAARFDGFLLTLLAPETTGLPMPVHARLPDSVDAPHHGMTLLVGLRPDARLEDGFSVVEIDRDRVRVVRGCGLHPDLLDQVGLWASLNRAALRAHWRGRLDSAELEHRVRRLPAEPFGRDPHLSLDLAPEATGLRGVVRLCSRRRRHAPRLRFVEAATPGAAGFSMSIEDVPVAWDRVPGHLMAEAERVAAWVTLNRAALLRFWTEGDTWTGRDIEAFRATLARLEEGSG